MAAPVPDVALLYDRLVRLERRVRDLEETNTDLRFVLTEITTIPAAQTLVPQDVLPRLTEQERRFLAALVHAQGVTVTTEGLLASVCYDRPDGDWPELHLMNVLACKVRRKLRAAGSGIVIQTVWGRGYRAIVPEETAAC